MPAPRDQVAEEQNRRQGRHDLDDEHDRVAPHHAGIKLAERVADRGGEDRRVEHRGDAAALFAGGIHVR